MVICVGHKVYLCFIRRFCKINYSHVALLRFRKTRQHIRPYRLGKTTAANVSLVCPIDTTFPCMPFFMRPLVDAIMKNQECSMFLSTEIRVYSTSFIMLLYAKTLHKIVRIPQGKSLLPKTTAYCMPQVLKMLLDVPQCQHFWNRSLFGWKPRNAICGNTS